MGKEKPLTGFPSGGKYVEALQNTNLCFRDPDLKGARPAFDGLGLPRPISGNFASVFSLTTSSGRRYAVKCFTRDVADQESRYKAISEKLAQLSFPWKVRFEYLSDAILVEGRWHPLLKMEWVEATSLSRWIEQNLHDSTGLATVSNSFAELVNDLAKAGVAHGDLQHGNLLVTPRGQLRLVDYDGMYVPSLAGSPAGELGHRNYQSPARSTTDFGPTIDRFSAWVIHLSLTALASDPDLWSQLREHDAEHLLLAENDFRDPSKSARFATLLSHTVPGIRDLAQRVQNLVTLPLDAIPQLSPIMVRPTSSDVSFAVAQPASAGPPSWIAARAANAPSTQAPPQEVEFTENNTVLRMFGLTALFLMPTVLILASLGFLNLGIAVLVSAASIVGWLLRAGQLYRATPEANNAHKARSHHDRLNIRSSEGSDHISKLDQQQRELERKVASETASQADRQRQLQDKYDRELASLQRSSQQRLNSIDTQLRLLRGDRQRQLDSALQQLQEDHIRSYLTKFQLSNAQLAGIGSSLVKNLQSCGITSAADFTGIMYSAQGGYQSRAAYFQLRNGQSVRVPGIGEVKASRLDSWRGYHQDQARLTQPTRLHSSSQQAIENQFSDRERQIMTERQQVADEITRKHADITQRLGAARVALADQIRQASATAARVRADLERQKVEAAVKLDNERMQMQAAIAEVRAYHQISYVRYLVFALRGK